MYKIFVLLLNVVIISNVYAEYSKIDKNSELVATPQIYTIVALPDNYQNDILSQKWIKEFNSNPTLLNLRKYTACHGYVSSSLDWYDWKHRWSTKVDKLPTIIIVQNDKLLYKRSAVDPSILSKEISQLSFYNCPTCTPLKAPYEPYIPNKNTPTPAEPSPDPIFPNNVIPDTPLVPDTSELDNLKKEIMTKINEISTKVESLSILVNKLENEQKNMSTLQQTELKNSIENLSSSLKNDIKQALTEVVKINDIESILQRSTYINDIKNMQQQLVKIEDLKNVSGSVDKAVSEITETVKQKTDILSEKIDNVAEHNTTLLKEVLEITQKPVEQPNTDTIYTGDLVNTAVKTTIPSSVLLVIGWWIRNVALRWVQQRAHSKIDEFSQYVDNRLQNIPVTK